MGRRRGADRIILAMSPLTLWGVASITTCTNRHLRSRTPVIGRRRVQGIGKYRAAGMRRPVCWRAAQDCIQRCGVSIGRAAGQVQPASRWSKEEVQARCFSTGCSVARGRVLQPKRFMIQRVAQARSVTFYRDFGVPDTVDGRFDMLVLHVFMILHRLKREGEVGRRTGQAPVRPHVR